MKCTGVFGTFYFLLAILQCRPASQWWINLKPNSGPYCLSPYTMTVTTYTAGALNTIADWTLGILPVFLVWNLSMNRRMKAIVAGILGFAALGSTATLVRIPFTKGLAETDDFLCMLNYASVPKCHSNLVQGQRQNWHFSPPLNQVLGSRMSLPLAYVVRDFVANNNIY